eukprot:2776050-Amphidinium_carterae.1
MVGDRPWQLKRQSEKNQSKLSADLQEVEVVADLGSPSALMILLFGTTKFMSVASSHFLAVE